HPNEMLEREALMQAVWADTFVEDANLTVAVSQLRKALGQSGEAAEYIETVPRVGYRFVAEVREVHEQPTPLVIKKRTLSHTVIEEEETESSEAVPIVLPAIRVSGRGIVATDGAVPAILPQARRRSSRLMGLALVFALVTGITLWVYFSRPASGTLTRSGSESSLSPMKMTLLTSFPGREEWPTFSPDGNQLAFMWSGEKGDNMDIYVKFTDAGAPLRLTTHAGLDNSPAWSPDAKYIACTRFDKGESAIFIIPALGGPERKLLSLGFNAHWFGNYASVVWSPGGQSVAFPDKSSPLELPGIFLASLETGEKRRLTSPPTQYLGDWFPAFSADGQTLAFTRSSSEGTADVYVIPVAGGEPRRLTFDNTWTVGPVWTPDGSSIVFLSLRGGTLRLWKVSASGGPPELLAIGGETFMIQQHPSPPSISRQGNRLVFAKYFEDINIWRMEVSRSTGRGISPTKLISSTQYDGAPQFSPDGQKIVFQSERSGLSDIWVCDREGANARQLTVIGGPLVGTPRWSPDGGHIAFDARAEGHSDIYVVNAEGGRPRRITTETSNDVVPSWSRNGRFVYFASNRTGTRPEVWKAPAAGGEARQVTKQGGFAAFESPDGKFLYYAKLDAAGLWRIPVEGGEERLILDQLKPREWGYWAVADRGIYFINSETKPHATIEFLSFAKSRVTPIATIEKEPINWASNLAISPDGRWILYTQLDRSDSDIMLVENFH
ncbi:MAG: winged helix-turn-helix domain-containing protein, partial [Acidobacteria bacterium]|nr:winged helix-turn-helix domain-containing protein [Acidobacteriota bacterium]